MYVGSENTVAQGQRLGIESLISVSILEVGVPDQPLVAPKRINLGPTASRYEDANIGKRLRTTYTATVHTAAKRRISFPFPHKSPRARGWVRCVRIPSHVLHGGNLGL